MTQKVPKIAVIIASSGRPDTLSTVLPLYLSQSYAPAQIIVSVASKADYKPTLSSISPNVSIVMGDKGLTAQRNTGLRQLNAEIDYVAFFDDDYVPSQNCLSGIVAFFEKNRDVVGVTGKLLADGINSPGISFEEASQMVADYDRSDRPLDLSPKKELSGLYGCNMAYRVSSIGSACFDERLKLYCWQEDIDFAAQLLPRGRLVKSEAFAGVHQGVKGGRTSGKRFGYSQVINPIYLCRKGTMQKKYAAKIIVKNVLSNHLRAFRPEPWVDRIGRVRGNWIGLTDIMKGRITPERIENMK